MKLIIQVPCFNEEPWLERTLAQLPRQLAGIHEIEWLVIDDGSSDATAEAALRAGADHVLKLAKHSGLAGAFRAGLKVALDLGADIIVNTDADNQYDARDIEKLLKPVLAGKADLVLGARSFGAFPLWKRSLQILGSRVVSRLSGTSTPDVRSGFRAMSRRLALRLDVKTAYTYTLETLIQAGREGFRVMSVPVRTNADVRPSRLIRNIPLDLLKSTAAIAGACRRFPSRPFPPLRLAHQA